MSNPGPFVKCKIFLSLYKLHLFLLFHRFMMLRLSDLGNFGADRRAENQDIEDSRPLLAKRARCEEQQSNFYTNDGASFHGNHDCGDLAKGVAMKIPDLIQALAAEGQCLRWDTNLLCYEVLNGSLFEQKFNALRSVRGKRKELAVDRPFARMHTYFVLLRGEKWAGTGTLFRPKSLGNVQPISSKEHGSSRGSSHLGSPDSEDTQHLISVQSISGENQMIDVALMQKYEDLAREDDLLFMSPVGPRGDSSMSQVLFSHIFFLVICSKHLLECLIGRYSLAHGTSLNKARLFRTNQQHQQQLVWMVL